MRGGRIVKRLSAFLGGQGSVQLLNALGAFALLRLMPRVDFAIYSITFGIQSTLMVLTDLGFGSAIIGLTGQQYQNRQILGTYIKSASSIRKALFMGALGLAILAMPVLLHHVPSAVSKIGFVSICCAVIASLQFQSWCSYYDTPLLLHNRVFLYYLPQIGAALTRLIGIYILARASAITAENILWLNTLILAAVGLTYRRLSQSLILLPSKTSKEHTREMVRYLSPLIPGVIYQAFQPQISLFLAASVAHINQVAEVAAAGRVGQIFLLLNVANGVLISPVFARSARKSLAKRYIFVLFIVCSVAGILVASAFLWPWIYLLLLGPKYSNLKHDIQLVVISSSLAYISGSMWAIASARKWIFWWGGTSQMILLISIQLVSAIVLPLGTSSGVLLMNVWVSMGQLVVQLAHLIHGVKVERSGITNTELAVG